jgi:hypothetical protein
MGHRLILSKFLIFLPVLGFTPGARQLGDFEQRPSIQNRQGCLGTMNVEKWIDLEIEYPLLRQGDFYVERLFHSTP